VPVVVPTALEVASAKPSYSFITIDPTNKDQLIAVDKTNHRLEIINRKDGSSVRTIGRQGSGTLQFNEPGGIAIDGVSKNIIVADRKNSRVQVIGYDAAGSVNHIRNIVMPANKFEGVWAPISVAATKIGDKGHVLVYSAGSDNIQFLSIDDGKFIRNIKLPKKTVEDGSRTYVNLAFDKYGNIIVVDGQNNCMQVMDNVTDVSGKVIAEIRGRKYFNGPRGVAVVHDAAVDHETIVVADTGSNRIQVFDLSYDDGGGRYTYPIPSKFEYNKSKSDQTTSSGKGLEKPYGILVDEDNSNIIVSDDKSPSTAIALPPSQPAEPVLISTTSTPVPNVLTFSGIIESESEYARHITQTFSYDVGKGHYVGGDKITILEFKVPCWQLRLTDEPGPYFAYVNCATTRKDLFKCMGETWRIRTQKGLTDVAKNKWIDKVLTPTDSSSSSSSSTVSSTTAPAPEPTLSKDEYVEVPFKKDPWSFYRSLMRGYLLYSDPDAALDADPATLDISKTSKIGRILHVGTTNDIRNMFNVFTFDDIVITECDMLFGLLSRISTWAKEKLKAKVPSVEDVESGGDYYMEQLKDFFQQKDSHIGTGSIDFLNKLIAIDLNLAIRSGGGRQTIRRDKHTSSRATRKKYAQSGGINPPVWWTLMRNKGNTDKKIWNDKVREHIRRTDPLLGDGDRSETLMTQIKKINVVPNPDEDDDDDDKDKKDGDDGLAKVMSTMTPEQYFKKISVPVKRINTNVSTSYSEIVPEVWGHPLLMLIPFAKAMQCDIALYGKEKDGDGSFKLRAHIKHKADDEMTTVFKMNPTEFTIRILDNNTDDEAYHENVIEYMSNFALIVPKGHYTNSGVGLLDKEIEIDKEEIAKKKSVETSRDAKKRTSDTAELKEINAQLETIKNDLFNLMKTHPAYATLDDKKIKDDVSRILAGYKVDRTSGTVRVSPGILSKKEDGDKSSKPKEESKKTIWWSSSSSSYDTVIQSAKKLKQTLKNKIRQNISKPRLILRLKDLISKEAALSAKKDQLTTSETSETTKPITAEV
jgi:hypothetical protein